jgi:hypothetical protein
MNRKSIIGLALAGAFVASAVVMATVTYNPETGGFAGKGDVKDALGLTESQIRDQAEGLVFTYSDEVTYDLPCIKENPAQILRKTFTRSRGVNATVSFEARRNGQGVLTGFILDPANGETTTEEDIACPGGFENDGWATLADLTPVSTSGGGLLVNGVALPNTL